MTVAAQEWVRFRFGCYCRAGGGVSRRNAVPGRSREASSKRGYSLAPKLNCSYFSTLGSESATCATSVLPYVGLLPSPTACAA